MNNPFVFGKVVRGDHFLNREDEILTITKALESGQNVICYSPRRYGKTSMMLLVKEKLEARGQLVFFIDLFRVTSLEDLYTVYANTIANKIKSPIKTLIETIQNILPTINPKIVFKGHESPTVEISVPIPVLSKTETLNELFNSFEKYCGKKKKKGIVIFDEFQEVTTIHDGPVIEREMRSAFQHHKNVSYAFLGSKQNLLKSIFKEKSRPFYNFGRHFELDVIGHEKWNGFIRKNMGKLCPENLIDSISVKTENHPFYTQMYCHYLWEYAQKHKIDKNSLDRVMDDILERDTALLNELWDRLTIKERHFLKAVAIEETGSIYDKNFLMTHGLGTASSAQKAAKRLFELDYIRKLSSGKISVTIPILKQWILRSKRQDLQYSEGNVQ